MSKRRDYVVMDSDSEDGDIDVYRFKRRRNVVMDSDSEDEEITFKKENKFKPTTNIVPVDSNPIIDINSSPEYKNSDTMVAILGYNIVHNRHLFDNIIVGEQNTVFDDKLTPDKYINGLNTIEQDLFVVCDKSTYDPSSIIHIPEISQEFYYYRNRYNYNPVIIDPIKIRVDYKIVDIKNIKLLIVMNAFSFAKLELIPSSIGFKRWFALEFAKNNGYDYLVQIDENVTEFKYLIRFPALYDYTKFLSNPQFIFSNNQTTKRSAFDFPEITTGQAINLMYKCMIQGKNVYHNIAMIGLPTDGRGESMPTGNNKAVSESPYIYKCYIFNVKPLKSANITYRPDLSYFAEDIAFVEDCYRHDMITLKMFQIKYRRSSRDKYTKEICNKHITTCVNCQSPFAAKNSIKGYINLLIDNYAYCNLMPNKTSYPGFINFAIDNILFRLSSGAAYDIEDTHKLFLINTIDKQGNIDYTHMNSMINNTHIYARNGIRYNLYTLKLADNFGTIREKCTAVMNTDSQYKSFTGTDMPYPLRWYLCCLIYQYQIGIKYQNIINKCHPESTVAVLHPDSKKWLLAMIGIFISIYPVHKLREYNFLDYIYKLPNPIYNTIPKTYVLPNWLDLTNTTLDEKQLADEILKLEPKEPFTIDYSILNNYSAKFDYNQLYCHHEDYHVEFRNDNKCCISNNKTEDKCNPAIWNDKSYYN